MLHPRRIQYKHALCDEILLRYTSIKYDKPINKEDPRPETPAQLPVFGELSPTQESKYTRQGQNPARAGAYRSDLVCACFFPQHFFVIFRKSSMFDTALHPSASELAPTFEAWNVGNCCMHRGCRATRMGRRPHERIKNPGS